MIEFLSFAFAPANLVFSLLMMLVLVFWGVFVLGALGVDFMDIDLDVDTDADVGADAGAGLGDGLAAVLIFFHVGQIPVTILVTLLVSTVWMMTVLGNWWLNPEGGLLRGLPVAAVTFVAGLAVVKVVGSPIARIFQALNRDYDLCAKVVGSLCRVTTARVSGRPGGQVEVTLASAPVLVNAVTRNGEELKLGDEAVIVEKDDARGVYVVAPVNLD